MITENQKQMIYWINERESIRKKKESGLSKPWSNNPVMQETYFCNVDREDDKVTKWIRDNWKYEFCKSTYTFAMIVARIFNLPSTLELIGQPHSNIVGWILKADRKLQDLQFEGGKVWNGAYIVSTNGKKIGKLEYCLQLFEGFNNHIGIIDDCETLEQAHKKLMTLEGLASFLAAQVVADLKNTEGHPLSGAPDWDSFCAPGPGSLRGLSWFWEKPVTNKNFNKMITDAYELLFMELDGSILDKLCMQNLQNCFCEYDKFMRVTNKTGRSKRKYNGKTA